MNASKLFLISLVIVTLCGCQEEEQAPPEDIDEKVLNQEPKDSIYYHNFVPNLERNIGRSSSIELEGDSLLGKIIINQTKTFNQCTENETGASYLTELKIQNRRLLYEAEPSYSYLTNYDDYNGEIFPGCVFYVEKDVVINNNFKWYTSSTLYIREDCMDFRYFCGEHYDTDKKYIPMKIDIDNKTYFGWLQMRLASDTVIIEDYAYKLIPNASIIAGQKK